MELVETSFSELQTESGSLTELMRSQKVDRFMRALVNVEVPDILVDVSDSLPACSVL